MWVYIKSGIVVTLIWYLSQPRGTVIKTVVTDVAAGGARCIDEYGNTIPCKQGSWGDDPDPLGLENDVNVENYITGLLQDATNPLLGSDKVQ